MELELSVPAVKGNQAAFNHVFSLTGMYLVGYPTRLSSECSAASERHPPREIKLPEWNLSVVRRSLTCPPYVVLVKHQIWKPFFLLVLSLAKRVTELYGLSFHV